MDWRKQMVRLGLGGFLGGLLAALLATVAIADFRENTCFPVGAGACVRTENIVVNGEQMVKSTAPKIVMHDIDAVDGDDNAYIRTNCTTTTTGAEECDFEIWQQTGGAETRVVWIDADGNQNFGHAGTGGYTFTSDGTGTGEFAIPVGSIDGTEVADASLTGVDLAVGTLTGANIGAVLLDDIILCGQNANSATIYGGPAAAVYLGSGGEAAIGGTLCDSLDNATEATADAPISADFPAIKIHGLFCRLSSDPTNDVVLTLRSAEAGLTPAVTCTVTGAGSATSCRALTSTTTNVAAGATLAVQSVTTEDLSLQDFWCKAYFTIQ